MGYTFNTSMEGLADNVRGLKWDRIDRESNIIEGGMKRKNKMDMEGKSWMDAAVNFQEKKIKNLFTRQRSCLESPQAHISTIFRILTFILTSGRNPGPRQLVNNKTSKIIFSIFSQILITD